MSERLLDYELRVEYRPGKTNISDYTWSHPLPRGDNTERELGTTKDVRHWGCNDSYSLRFDFDYCLSISIISI